VVPEDNRHREWFVHALSRLMINVEVFSWMDVDIGCLPVHDLAPDKCRIPYAGLRIFGHHESRCNVRAGVGFMSGNVREFGDIELPTFFDDFLNRCGANDLRANGLLLTLAKSRHKIGRSDAQSESHEFSTRRHADYDGIA
jgi:hypothetical protein